MQYTAVSCQSVVGRGSGIGQKSILPTKPKISRLITRRLIECLSSLLHLLLLPETRFQEYAALLAAHLAPGSLFQFDALPPPLHLTIFLSLFLSLPHSLLSHSYSCSGNSLPPARRQHYCTSCARSRHRDLYSPSTFTRDLLLFLHLSDPLFLVPSSSLPPSHELRPTPMQVPISGSDRHFKDFSDKLLFLIRFGWSEWLYELPAFLSLFRFMPLAFTHFLILEI